MEKKDLTYFNIILNKYQQGIASAEEVAFLEKYYNLFEDREGFLDSQDPQLQEAIRADMKSKIDEQIALLDQKPAISIFKNSFFRYFAAACMLLMVSIACYFALWRPAAQPISKTNDFVPGKNKALLELANGTQIWLDTAAKGAIAQLDGITIFKNAQGEIEYKLKATPTGQEVGFNTITTPNGGHYQVVLHDGSKVWLNSGSSIKYPTAFRGKDRTVSITGEAYFEVAKNKAMPFKVITESQTIEVLGTHFNINAYKNEDAIKTTLLEGAVKVNAHGHSLTIAPGEQTSFDPKKGDMQKSTVDVEQDIAWKNGLFSFKGDDLKAIMRQISRWYDVEIEYNGQVTDEKFYGQISRDSKLSEVFAILELNNVHFKNRGRKIIVSSN